MKDRNIPIAAYEQTAQFFNPADFDAAEWVNLAKAAGMHYITFTCKYRDGFSMWNSAASDWNVVKSTPFGRDVVKELADECRRQGIKLFLYYSPLDWYRSEPVRVDANGGPSRQADTGATTESLAFTNAQLTELLTKYGKIDGVWLDGWWDGPEATSQLQQTYELIHRLQPAALVGNHYIGEPIPGQDFQTFARSLPMLHDAGTTDALQYSKVPLEVCDTINESWGYQITDHQYKSTRELIHYLVRAAGTDSNFLLNVGPMPDGQVQSEFQERLKRVGMWLAKHGESIYATRGGPVAPQPWGVTTHRRHKVYVHVLDPETTSVELQLPHKLRTARYLLDESDIPYEEVDGKIVLSLRPERRGEMERLLVLETRHYN